MSTNLTELREVSSTPLQQPRRRRLLKLAVFLVSGALCLAVFLAFDWTFSAAMKRAHMATAAANLPSCRIADPVRHHAFQPSCATIDRWGEDSYVFATNSLGFRDEKVRDVPQNDPRPRILVLGNSFTEGKTTWNETFVGRMADRFPQYEFLNAGEPSYSPSNYLNVVRMMLARGFDLDEVIVFVDNTSPHYEASFYRDVDASGAVTGPEHELRRHDWYTEMRFRLAKHMFATSDVLQFLERHLVGLGFYRILYVFDVEWAAWTYRKVDEVAPYPAGYAPLGLDRGLAKEKVKMDLLWQELEKRNIPISVVVYPYPGLLIHDTVDSRLVRIWRQWCEGKCKRFITLFPAFFAARDKCSPFQTGCWYEKLYAYGDVHYSSSGNALVADAVIKSLAEDPPAKLPKANLPPEPASGRAAP